MKVRIILLIFSLLFINGQRAMEPLVIGANDPGGCYTKGIAMDSDGKGNQGSPESIIAVGGTSVSKSYFTSTVVAECFATTFAFFQVWDVSGSPVMLYDYVFKGFWKRYSG